MNPLVANIGVYKTIYRVIQCKPMKDDAKNTFGRRLRQARTMQGLSLRALAELLGATISHTALA